MLMLNIEFNKYGEGINFYCPLRVNNKITNITKYQVQSSSFHPHTFRLYALSFVSCHLSFSLRIFSDIWVTSSGLHLSKIFCPLATSSPTLSSLLSMSSNCFCFGIKKIVNWMKNQPVKMWCSTHANRECQFSDTKCAHQTNFLLLDHEIL